MREVKMGHKFKKSEKNGSITEVTLGYENTTIVMDSNNKLIHDEVALK